MNHHSIDRSRTLAVAVVTAAAAHFASSPAVAGSLFQLSGNTTDAGPLVNFTQGSSNLPDFITDLIEGSGQFNNLNNRAFLASLNYANVHDALRFNVSQGGPGWQAQLTSPFEPTLINQNFSAPTRQQLEDQIDHYLEQNGQGDLARFLAAMNKRTVAGSLDGNPVSATAMTASTYFGEYGMRPTETADEADEEGGGDEETSRSGFSMTADVGRFSSQGIEGETYSWTPMIPYTFGKSRRVRAELSIPLNYTVIEGADQFRAGSQLGVACLILKRAKDQPWLWQVTPHGGALVTGSVDMISGGVLASGGVTSYLSYRWGAWELSMGNHISFHEAIGVTVEDYEFDPDISQQILKNGLKLGRSLGKRWYVEAYAIDTEFLQDAYIERYTTVGAGIGYRGPKRKGYVMLGGYANLGGEFDAAHLQFGTGWKF